jgi:hypothetical protein
MFNFSWSPTRTFLLTFQVTNTTAIFFALIWLPVLLNVFALLGGGVKTPAGEVSSSGLGEILKSLNTDTLGVIIEDTAPSEKRTYTDGQEELQKIQQEAQEVYLARISPQDARQELLSLATRYNEVRSTLSPGSERSLQMRSITGRMRSLAPLAGFTGDEITAFLQSSDKGKRLLGISIARVIGSSQYFDAVLAIISNSHSAYEQYHALAAMNDTSYVLNHEQRARLTEVIKQQRDYNPENKQWIPPNSDRDMLSAQILSSIQAHKL